RSLLALIMVLAANLAPISSVTPLAFASSAAGPSLPTTCIDDTTDDTGATGGVTGTNVWTNPSSAQSSTDSQASATASPSTTGGATHYLKCTGFGFTLPSNATVDGIS